MANARWKKDRCRNLYIGGALLSLHWKNIQEGNDAYRYRKTTDLLLTELCFVD
ncbi:DUF4886 domain-containing protein [Olivibacter sp. CPCC 100613]|uniref:DUF4886 domain-containing protein n=1 Tax=Olivibacter sp. CPCC 100613 TaxID=3079931 RepID=UPI002FFB6C28